MQCHSTANHLRRVGRIGLIKGRESIPLRARQGICLQLSKEEGGMNAWCFCRQVNVGLFWCSPLSRMHCHTSMHCHIIFCRGGSDLEQIQRFKQCRFKQRCDATFLSHTFASSYFCSRGLCVQEYKSICRQKNGNSVSWIFVAVCIGFLNQVEDFSEDEFSLNLPATSTSIFSRQIYVAYSILQIRSAPFWIWR